MADDADLANEHLDNQLLRTIAKIRENAVPKIIAEECVECGEEIPEARRDLGFEFCVACAETIEKQEALFASN